MYVLVKQTALSFTCEPRLQKRAPEQADGETRTPDPHFTSEVPWRRPISEQSAKTYYFAGISSPLPSDDNGQQ
jgi:hypothetical protein